jgi:hypothetical protein
MREDGRQTMTTNAHAEGAGGWRAQLELQRLVSEAALKRATIATWAAIVSLAIAVVLVFEELIEIFGK